MAEDPKVTARAGSLAAFLAERAARAVRGAGEEGEPSGWAVEERSDPAPTPPDAAEGGPHLFQHELPLAPVDTGQVPPVPVRMAADWAFCPRLVWLEWVDREWADNADTVEGSALHARVDRKADPLPDAQDITEDQRIHARSVELSDAELGLIGKIDLVEGEDGRVHPVEYKRGRRPHNAAQAHDAHRIQVCLQAMLLERHGYAVDHGILYYAGSRERTYVALDEDLRAGAMSALQGLRVAVAFGRTPPPLIDSPKCPRCSLVSICMPDEVATLKGLMGTARSVALERETALPAHVQARWGKIGKKGDTLEIQVEDAGEKVTVRLTDLSELVLYGAPSITTQALHELMRRGIPVSFHSHGGWFQGMLQSSGHNNVELRNAQFRAAFDPERSRALARGLVAAKIRNCATILRRNWRGAERPELLGKLMKRHEDEARRASTTDQLLGIEGAAAQLYFRSFPSILAERALAEGFDFRRRERRPPPDPINAALGFAYALLVRQWTVVAALVGLDPYRGFYHQPRFGRPSLALDLMEPYRPLLADSVVAGAINNGELKARDFAAAGRGVTLNESGRKALLAAFERRLGQEFTHPLFGYQLNWRQAITVQTRLFARQLLGEIAEVPHITPR